MCRWVTAVAAVGYGVGAATMPTMALTRPTANLFRRGRELLENLLRSNQQHEIISGLPKKKGLKINPKDRVRNEAPVAPAPSPSPAAGKGVWADGVASFLARTTSRTLAAELRRKAALQFGTRTPVVRRAYWRTPLYSFIGLGVVGGFNAGEQEEEEAYDEVCSRIKALFRTKKAPLVSGQPGAGCHLDDYTFGSLIAKGCNSAVYSARLKDTQPNNEVGDWNSKRHEPIETSGETEGLPCPPPVQLTTISEESEDEDSSLSNLSSSTSSSSFCVLNRSRTTSTGSDITFLSDDLTAEGFPSLSRSDITVLDEEEEMDVCSDDDSSYQDDSDDDNEDLTMLTLYPLAVKMMFNYDAESNASTILRTMENEAVPAKMADITGYGWENGNRVKKKRLKPHPNVVDMFGVFVDDVPQLPDALVEYPDALPQRLNPDGCGRNKTMFIVMKRYRTTLRQYLTEHLPTERESTLLLVQLMESLLHLNNQGIAHRDVKSDNILLDGDSQCPHLVITDFGCCLADDVGLRVPYVSDDVTKGGNCSLMAPEIATARPGRRRYLDYRKSDMWAAGSLVYEIFGGENPFYGSRTLKRLDSRTYRSKTLPPLPPHAPRYMYRIARSMLRWRPSRRPAVKTVTNALHLLLWGPSEWRFLLELKGLPPSKVEVIRWLLNFTTGVMVERASQRSKFTDPQRVEHMLKCQFLARLSFEDVMDAVDYLWNIH